jgi:hypothetical protein
MVRQCVACGKNHLADGRCPGLRTEQSGRLYTGGCPHCEERVPLYDVEEVNGRLVGICSGCWAFNKERVQVTRSIGRGLADTE